MERRRLHLLILLLFLLIFAYFYNGGGGNQVARFNLTRAIVQQGSFALDGVAFPSDDQLRVDGHLYSSKAPGTSLLGVPFYALFQGILLLTGFIAPLLQNAVVHLTTIFTVGLPSALMGLCLYLMLLELGARPPRALFAASATLFGTIFFPYATMFFGHSLAAALGFMAFFLLYQAHAARLEGRDPGKRVLFAALLTSGAVITEYPMGIAALIFTVYLVLTRPRRQELAQWAGGGAVGVILLMGYNLATFGNPFALSYLNYARASRNAFPIHAEGLGGVTWPRLEVLDKILTSNERGLFWFSPVVLLLVPALAWLLLKRRALWKELLVICLMVVGFLAFNAGYGTSIRYWGGANSAGPRHLIPMLPFAGLAIGLLIDARPWLCALLAVPSMAICLAVTAVMPQIPMLYSSPLGQFIFPYFLEGRLAMHRGGMVSDRLVTADSIAYNWGKLLGLPGTLSLLPLAVLVFGLVVAITLHLRREGHLQPTGQRLGLAALGVGLSVMVLASPYHTQASAIPLKGPGVAATFYPKSSCSGTPVLKRRLPDLSYQYNQDDVRPFPFAFCGRLATRLQLTEPGTIGFKLSPQEARLWIDGNLLLTQVDGEKRPPVELALEAGPHRLEVEYHMSITSQRFEVTWAPPGELPRRIPPRRLTADWSKPASWDILKNP